MFAFYKKNKAKGSLRRNENVVDDQQTSTYAPLMKKTIDKADRSGISNAVSECAKVTQTLIV